jgi:hypothetical protein
MHAPLCGRPIIAKPGTLVGNKSSTPTGEQQAPVWVRSQRASVPLRRRNLLIALDFGQDPGGFVDRSCGKTL